MLVPARAVDGWGTDLVWFGDRLGARPDGVELSSSEDEGPGQAVISSPKSIVKSLTQEGGYAKAQLEAVMSGKARSTATSQ